MKSVRLDFSLLGLLIFTSLIASVVCVVLRNERWVRLPGAYESYYPLLPCDPHDYWHIRWSTPDQTREIDPREGGVGIWDPRESKYAILYYFDSGGTPIGFIDNDRFIFELNDEASRGLPGRYVIYKRRFPEWWWGHFYRLEVWLTIVLGIVWLIRLRRWFMHPRVSQNI